MGTTVMPESHGAWWSYPIYSAGFVVAAMGPDQWLVALSILAVLSRLAIDLPTAIEKHRPRISAAIDWLIGFWR